MRALWGIGMGGAILLAATLTSGWGQDVNRTTGSAATTNDWFDPAAWTLGHAPLAGEDVWITNSLVLTNETPWLNHCVISNRTVVFSNWTTRLRAVGDVLVTGASARLTLPGPFAEGAMSNRVHVVCSNFILATGARIDVTACGYLRDTGPGKGAGASYGDGRLGYAFGPAYGSLTEPTDPGSGATPGASASGHGGGAVRIEATNAVQIFGSILANGGGRGGIHGHGGSGGSIFITCRTLGGSAAGLLQARGESISHGGISGGGGRIAVIYDPAAQAGVNPGVRFDGQAGSQSSGYNSFWRNHQGTLYLPDNTFLATNLIQNQFIQVTYFSPGFTHWSVPGLVISNNAIDFGEEGFELTVAGDLVLGPAGILGLRSNAQLRVGRHLKLEGGGQLSLRSGPTNDLRPEHGLGVEVGGTLQIASNAWVYPWSHPINGGSPVLRAGSMTIDAGGGIDANYLGFANNRGYGKPGTFAGAGYGGKGGNSDRGTGGSRYGYTNMPLHPGSGGAMSEGGGLIRIEAGGTVTVDGQLRANGSGGGGTHYGGGPAAGFLSGATPCAGRTRPDSRRMAGMGHRVWAAGAGVGELSFGRGAERPRPTCWIKSRPVRRARF